MGALSKKKNPFRSSKKLSASFSSAAAAVDQSSATIEMLADDDDDHCDNNIWYFGFGPIVHPQVRLRRGIVTMEEQPAVLRDHQLTFAFGGVATVVRRRGYTVHGVLMRLQDRETWKKLKEFDKGYYEPEENNVYPYKANEYDEGCIDEFFESTTPISCFVFVQNEFDQSLLEKNVITKKPQERYLLLISQGMRQYHVDDGFIDDEIMACPFIPGRKEEDWYVFPPAHKKMPKITFEAYQKLCHKHPDDLYFITGTKVIKADQCPDGNSAVGWMKQHAHGKPDITHKVHQMIVCPSLPYAATEAELTEKHYRWVENHICDFLLPDVTGHTVYTLKESSSGGGHRRLNGLFSSSVRQQQPPPKQPEPKPQQQQQQQQKEQPPPRPQVKRSILRRNKTQS